MNERRAAVRKRVIYGAVATSRSDGRQYKCVVKNWSDLGARVEFGDFVDLTDDVSLILEQTGASYRARVVWLKYKMAGLAFISAPTPALVAESGIEKKLRDSEAKARLLQRRVNELLGES